jgi:transposase
MACASVVSPIEIFAADEVGRRRHWSDEDKIRIVEESLHGYMLSNGGRYMLG